MVQFQPKYEEVHPASSTMKWTPWLGNFPIEKVHPHTPCLAIFIYFNNYYVQLLATVAFICNLGIFWCKQPYTHEIWHILYNKEHWLPHLRQRWAPIGSQPQTWLPIGQQASMSFLWLPAPFTQTHLPLHTLQAPSPSPSLPLPLPST